MKKYLNLTIKVLVTFIISYVIVGCVKNGIMFRIDWIVNVSIWSKLKMYYYYSFISNLLPTIILTVIIYCGMHILVKGAVLKKICIFIIVLVFMSTCMSKLTRFDGIKGSEINRIEFFLSSNIKDKKAWATISDDNDIKEFVKNVNAAKKVFEKSTIGGNFIVKIIYNNGTVTDIPMNLSWQSGFCIPNGKGRAAYRISDKYMLSLNNKYIKLL